MVGIFQSVRHIRYAHLCIYHLSVLATAVRVSPKGDRIAIGGVKIGGSGGGGNGASNGNGRGFVEIGLFSLPPKLLATCPVEQGLNNKRDFTLVAGARTECEEEKETVRQIRFLTDTTLVTQSAAGVCLWRQRPGTDLLEPLAKYSHGERELADMELGPGGSIYCHDGAQVFRLNVASVGESDDGSSIPKESKVSLGSAILDLAVDPDAKALRVVCEDGTVTTLCADDLTRGDCFALGRSPVRTAVFCGRDPSVVAFLSPSNASSGDAFLHIRLPDGRIVTSDVAGISGNRRRHLCSRLERI